MRTSNPIYKSTAIPWLPEMPEHWDVRKAKFIFKKENREVREDDDVVTAFRDGQVTLRKKRREDGFTIAVHEIGYQGIRKGDLVIHGMDAFAGAIGVSDSDGKASPVYNACTLRVPGNMNYFCHAIRQMSKSGFIQSLAKGIRERSTDFRFDTFGQQYLPFPPLAEQTAIANYLDAKTEQINRFIEKKEKLIALLKEQKQAVINDVFAECKRKYPNLRLKYLAKINPTKSFSKLPIQDDDNVVFLPMEKVSEEGEIDCSLLKQTVELKNGFTFFERGDIIVAKITPCFENGKGALLNNLATSYGFGSTEFHTIRPNKRKILPEYLRWVIYSEAFRSLGEYFMVGSAGQKRVPVEYVSNYVVALPSLEHQAQIVDEILFEVNRIDKAIKQIEIEVEKVKELKQSLIAEVVTGRIKVA